MSPRRGDGETLGAGFNAGYHPPFEFNTYVVCDPSRPHSNTCSITFQKSIDLAWRGGIIHKKEQNPAVSQREPGRNAEGKFKWRSETRFHEGRRVDGSNYQQFTRRERDKLSA